VANGLSYIPDEVRKARTDRLVHRQDSLKLVLARHLPSHWTVQAAADNVRHLHWWLSVIGAELHRRELLHDKAHRATRNSRYEMSNR